MLIKEAISKALKDLGVSTDDTTMSSRYVYMYLKAIRSELLRQEVEKKGTWKNFPMQTLKHFEMKRIDIAESVDFTAGEYIFKSDKAFPEPLDTKTGKVIGGVFLPTGERLDVTSYLISNNSKNRRHRATTSQAYMRGNHLYIRYYTGDTSVLLTDVDAVFENPEEVDVINNIDCDTDECIFYPDLEFHLPSYLEGRFFRMVKEDISWSLRITKDKENNGTEDTAIQQQQQRRATQEQNQ